MEGTHSKLGPRFSNGLCRDDTDRLADFHQQVVGKVVSIAKLAQSRSGLAGDWGAEFDCCGIDCDDRTGRISLDDMVLFGNDSSIFILDVLERNASQNTLEEVLAGELVVLAEYDKSFLVFAVFLLDDNILRYVHETASQIAGACGT